ncbi:hypothetical protein [Cellulosimicrobium cellulans]|uniref:hypothetical protein n=1 Tax=Cellulosimicrobium cellulans TaxID=1710 RepID=UPI0002DB1B35|nr:hypothetical protein [Cellulosimicrobium cellulans]
MARTKPGRKKLGERSAHTLRLPRDHMEFYAAEAARLGYDNLNAYFVAELARPHELDVPYWAQQPSDQEGQQQLQLPIGA